MVFSLPSSLVNAHFTHYNTRSVVYLFRYQICICIQYTSDMLIKYDVFTNNTAVLYPCLFCVAAIPTPTQKAID